MSVSHWFEGEGWKEVPADALARPYALRFAAFMTAGAEGIASEIKSCQRSDGAELVTFMLRTERPQRPPVDIRYDEPAGVIFPKGDGAPLVISLRDDFPDTEHQNLVPEGVPVSLCIDNRPWEDVRLGWTPAELLQRLALWFRRAARNELHEAAQGAEPFFGGSELQIILPAEAISGAAAGKVELHGFLPPHSDGKHLIVRRPADIPAGATLARFTFVGYRVQPDRMRRMRFYPRNLYALSVFMAARGIGMLDDLKTRIIEWHGIGEAAASRLASYLAVILELPVVNAGGSVTGVQTLALLSDVSIGQVGVALGVFEPNTSGVGDARGFVRTIGAREAGTAALERIRLEMANVHLAFDAPRAAHLAGRARCDARKTVLIGAGAIGAHAAEYLAREGRFEWTIIDHDTLLPHNLARHNLTAAHVGVPKAVSLSSRLRLILGGEDTAKAITANVLKPGDQGDAIEAALASASVVIDASASVAASRHIADVTPASARAASMFFNPSGTAAVLLAEPAGRSVTLRDLEAQYYRAILQRPELEDHLAQAAVLVPYAGACRALTSRIPETSVAALSALAAAGLTAALAQDAGMIAIWILGEDGTVVRSSVAAENVTRHEALGWRLVVGGEVQRAIEELRRAKLPRETGGVLLGVIDHLARSIHVVEALPAPVDSAEDAAAFERGIERLTETAQAAIDRTLGQIRYVGEWHSHPPRASTRPSGTDLCQLVWLSGLVRNDGVPAVMLIAGDEGLRVLLCERRN